MPATPDRITFATREFAFTTREDATIRTLHPDARDQAEAPAVSFFTDLAMAAAINAERAALLMALPRRLAVTLSGALTTLDTALATPTVRIVDDEIGVDDDMLISRLAVDTESETASLELYRAG